MRRYAAITASRNALLVSVALVALSTAAMADPLIDGEDLSGFTTDNSVPLLETMGKGTVSTGVSDDLYLSENGTGDVFFSLNQPLGLNNNGYGTTSTCGSACGTDPQYNWSKQHTFSDLLGSDQADFTFYDSKGNAVFTFDFDYASTDKTSGAVITCGDLGSSTCDGGNANMDDGGTVTGTASWLTKYATSLTYDCGLAGSSSYCSGSSPNSPTKTQLAKWVNQIIYQGEISHLAFGANGFGGVSLILQHDSPSEDGFDMTFGCMAGSGGTGVNGTCGLNNPTPVPEPSPLSLLVGGFLGLLLYRFRAIWRGRPVATA